MKKFIHSALTLVVALALFMSMGVSAMATTGSTAAANTTVDRTDGVLVDPYGYYQMDDMSGYWHVQFCTVGPDMLFDTTDGVEMHGNDLYAETDLPGTANKLLTKGIDTLTGDVTKATVGFDPTGRLYAISKGVVRRMDNTGVSTYDATENIKAVCFVLNEDELVTGVKMSNGKTINTADLVFTGKYNVGDDTPVTDPGPVAGNKVITHTRGDSGWIHDAYKNGVIVLSTETKNSNVWLATFRKLLSQTCRGSKFVGYSREYAIILLDQDGTLYGFQYGNYDTAKTVAIQEKVLGYDKDSNGFIYAVRTSRTTYLLDKLFEDIVYGKVTSVTNNAQTGSVSYSNNNKVGELSLTNGYLFWSGTKLAHSNNPTSFGITVDNHPVWISAGDMYMFDGRNIIFGKTNVTRIGYSSTGIAEKYYIGATGYPLSSAF